MGVIDDKLKDIEKRFNELDKMRKELQEQGAELNRRLSAVVTEQERLKGADRELRDVLKKEPNPKLEIPPEKPEKKKKK